MRRSLITGLMLLGAVAAPGTAIGQQLQWATSAGGTQADSAQSVGVDAAGNSYVVGTFAVAATFGAGQANQTVLTSAGAITSQDVFVAKYDPAGSLVWARGIGATDPPSGGYAGTDFGWDIAVDAAGNSYVTGAFASGTSFADFGNGVTTGGQGPFAARYDPEGNAIWATSLGPAGHGVSIDVDASGNSYVAGFAPLPGIGGETVTVWKLTPAGTPAWVRQASFNGVGGSRALGISVDDSGVSRVTGRIQAGSFVFGSGETAETTLVDANTSGEVFIASYDTLGTLIWARQSVSTVGAWGQGVASDEDGGSYVTGFFHGSTTFGSGSPNETTLAAATATLSDLFIAKYDGSGGLVWARPVLATGNAGGTGIAVAGGSLYVTGWFAGFVTVAPGQGNEVMFSPSADGVDVLIAKYDGDGALVWARTDGGDTASPPAFDQATGIAVNDAGSVFVSGEFPGTATLGTGDPNQAALVSAGQTDMFLARYEDGAPAPPLDLDVGQFRATRRVALSRGQAIDVSLVVQNPSTVSGSADATVVGMQGGTQVYSHTLSVTDAPGNGRTRFDFPGFTPVATGEIAWTVTIADADADLDAAATSTLVVP